MALTSIELTVKNNEFKGYVEITSIPKAEPAENVAYVIVSRKQSGSQYNYKKIYEKEISGFEDLAFYYNDMTTKSGTSYDYFVELTDSNETGYTTYESDIVSNIECWFDGLFVGDENTQYLAPLDCETSTTRNTQSNYVTTLAGKTPYRISNSNLNYTTGQSSAIFMPLDEEMNPVKQYTKEYVEEVVSFLSDGEDKILKTSDGGMWYVSIDPNIQIDFNNHFAGYNRISFDWTEIDEMPSDVSADPIDKRLINKTIVLNGTYYPSQDSADGYNIVTVNVPSVRVSVQGHTLIYQTQ